MITELEIKTRARTEMLDITDKVRKIVKDSGIKEGICYLYVPHTTAGITINEDADPDVARDILHTLEEMIPYEGNYRHSEGNAAAHIKTSLIGSSKYIPIKDREMVLGKWQGIFFCEFDGPRSRKLILKLTEG
ncbi:MAG: secondary thiamine-phosphate synthase enzyme YjbQ [Nitrospirota bacterium]